MLILSAQCRAARGVLGWSREDLSIRSGVSHRTIAAFELDTADPRTRTIEDLARAFEEAGIEFFQGNDPRHNESAAPQVGLRWSVRGVRSERGGD